MSKLETTKATKATHAVKGFKHTKPGVLLGLGGSAFGAFGVVRDLRRARDEHDTLKLVNATIGALALVTGTLLLVRELRQLGKDDILAG
jgi:hypothetical protein